MMFKTSWDLTQLYKSPNDPAIERDIARIKSAYTRFEKKYRSKQYLQNDALLLKALQEYVQLDALPNPLVYLHLFGDIDSSNSTVIAKQTAVAQIFTALANSILFFRLSLMSFSKQKQKEILTNKSFSKYHYFLRQIFSQATYSLSEAEEKILNLQSLPAQSLWVDGQSKLFSVCSTPAKVMESAPGTPVLFGPATVPDGDSEFKASKSVASPAVTKPSTSPKFTLGLRVAVTSNVPSVSPGAAVTLRLKSPPSRSVCRVEIRFRQGFWKYPLLIF
jgi:hypothetical protein